MSVPEVSVIIPTCNRPDQLSACLEALAVQSLGRERFEVIVVDDGGAAPAEPVLAGFSARLNLRSARQSNAGPAAARNAGSRLARGHWLAFTDDDCAPAPGWLEGFQNAFSRNPDALLGGMTVNALYANPYSCASQLVQDFVYAYYNMDPIRARFFASNNIAMPADRFHALGGFNSGFRTSEDRDLCARWLASSRPMIFTTEALVRHAHPLDLVSYWCQHRSYGRGARKFQRAFRALSGRSSIEPSFYYFLLRSLPASLIRHHMPFAMAALLGVWQAANLTGWFLETLDTWRSNASR